MNKKNITTMVLVSIAMFIYMLLLETFVPTDRGSILPGAIGAAAGVIVLYVIFGTRFERPLNKIVSIFFGFPIAGLFVGIAKNLKVEVTLPMFIVFLIIGVCISVALFKLIDKKTERKKLETAYKTDERGAMLNEKSATAGFIALSLFLLTYLIKDYFEAGIFDKILLLTLCGGWVVCILTRFYYEWRM
jgi:membrane-associated PAP2 superfamily phosphatase